MEIVEYAITAGEGIYAVQVFRLQWSDDGAAWTDAESTRTLTGTWLNGQTRVFTVGGAEIYTALTSSVPLRQRVTAPQITHTVRLRQRVFAHAVHAVPLRQRVAHTQFVATLPLRQRVTATQITCTVRLRQRVFAHAVHTVPLRQRVAQAQFVATLPLRQRVHGSLTSTVPLRQRVRDGAVAPAAMQRPGVVVTLAGIDITARLTDALEVDIEAGQSRRAALSFLPLGGTVDLAAWISAPLTVDLDGGAGPMRVFTGTVSDTRFDPLRRVTTLDATDDLQATLDALPRVVIDIITAGAAWSAAVSDAEATGYAYAQDRMASLPADLDRDGFGAFRVTPWAAAPVPTWTFGGGAIIDESLRVEPGRWREMINRVAVTVEVRYTRRLHRTRSIRWAFTTRVDTGGAMANYLYLHATLPTEDMIKRAAETNGWKVVSERYDQRAPSGVYDGIMWSFNPAAEAHPWRVLGADITAARRWSQTITETYDLVVEAPASIARFGANVSQRRATYSAADAAQGWEDAELASTPGGIGGTSDLSGALTAGNGDRYFDDIPAGVRAAAIDTALAAARVELLAGHRVHAAEFSTPLAPDVDTADTARVETANITAQGRVRQVTHRVEIGGAATTTVRVALSQSAPGAQADDALTAPAVPAVPAESTHGLVLGSAGDNGTHLGGYMGAPEYIRAAPYTADEDNPAWTGYVGNREPPWGGSVTFEERFAVAFGDIARDPIDTAAAATYRVAIPHDTLEMAA